MEKWIWLDTKRYPQSQTTIVNLGLEYDREGGNFTVAEFFKEYTFEDEVEVARLYFSGDTTFELYLNEIILATGPVNAGGDFLLNRQKDLEHYGSELSVRPDAKKLRFYARVKMMPCALNEYSRGQGGFMLWAKLRLKNGRIKYISTDETWLCRKNQAYVDPYTYAGEEKSEEYIHAAEVPDVWHTKKAPIPLRTERMITDPKQSRIKIMPGETKEVLLEFDKIYAGYVSVGVKSQGKVSVKLEGAEVWDTKSTFTYMLSFCGEDTYRGLQLHSIGLYRAKIVNYSSDEAWVDLALIETHYPVSEEAKTFTSDEALNRVLEVCRHTLKSCRQMMHLDSPQHCEPLACTGDYYIETLMTAMSFGDMELAKLDVLRTARLLRMHEGRMFHTTYSLIWVLMLWDVYMFCGEETLLTECEDALSLLLERFEGYLGDNGLIETPPDYMFVDWIYLDGISLHHPPKALGQTSLCAFYYGALKTAEKIYEVLKEPAEQKACREKAEALQRAVNTLLYDREKGLYFDGLNTPTPEELLGTYMPQNVEKRYYLPHSNILCTYFGICEKEVAENILKKAVEDKEWGICQPYFKHFLLEAVFRWGLCEEYTLKILEEWKTPIEECPKGLVEGFIKPEPTYRFDHSHAWGGTPLYSLPKALLGLEILEPRYRKIRISPKLLGLERVHVEVPTPYGKIIAELNEGKENLREIPKEIEVEG